MDHLDDNAASEFVCGTLPPAQLGRVEGHLASCRDCRALVAALAADAGDDSNARTFRHERISPSQAAELPRRMLSIGDRVSRYLVLSSLGSGGMGVVFAAYDPQLDRKIALKLLRSGLAGSGKDARARLRREAQAIAQLSHPNVVSVYDVGTTDDGDLYIAMEFVEGDTLTTWLGKYPRTWREIIDVFVQAARGLLAAHGVGLLHRDFKPDNVLVGGDGRVRVTDFGLARSLLAPDEVRPRPAMTPLSLTLTATGTVLGTPRYMPPEQLTGPELDARSDQFSFCVALYEALYGSHPLRDGTSVLMLEQGDRARQPPEGTRIPAAIGRAVLRGLERDRARRFPSMASVIDELLPSPRRSPRYAALAVGALVLLGGGTTALVARERVSAHPPTAAEDITQLTDELRQKEDQRQALLTALIQARADQAELAAVRAALVKKDGEIRDLSEKVAQLQTANARLLDAAKRSVRLAAASRQTLLVVDTLNAAQRPIEGCFREWAERNEVTHDEVSEATMIVELTVTPGGVGAMGDILSTPDEHLPGPDGARGRSLLEMCVSEQIARVRFPPGPDRLQLEAMAQWSPGQVKLSVKLLDRRAMPQGQIELP